MERGAERRRSRHRKMAAVGALIGTLAIAAALYAYTRPPATSEPERVVASADTLPYTESVETSASDDLDAVSSAQPTTSPTVTFVEVPDVVGRTVADADRLLQAAGLVASVPEGAAGNVQGQDPQPGAIVPASTAVSLRLAAVAPKKAATSRSLVVCIDPGHQARSDAKKEPVGPGSTTMKPRVAGGATGVETGIPEYEIALQISMNLKQRLEASGIRVVMTRTTNDVNISNAERAEIANKAKAALFVRVHANGSPESSSAGVSTLYPGATEWTKPIVAKSKTAADFVQRAVLTSTGAPNDGVTARTDLAGFNWAKVPTVLVECGYLSNPVEDRLLSSPAYQDKVAMGIASGVLRFLGQ